MSNRYAYLLVFNPLFGTTREVREYVDSRPEILNWQIVLPNTMLLVSDYSAGDLTQILHSLRRRDGARFMIIDVNTDKNGWLPKTAWTFMNHPKAVGEE